jgi:DNA-binding transcriptional MerR regulator
MQNPAKLLTRFVVAKIEKPVLKKPDGRKNNGGSRENSGRKAFEPTDAERMDQIAILVRDGINVETLRKYFERELATGKAKANSKIGSTLYQKAVDGDTTSLIWWSKTQMRWKEVQQHEISGIDNAAPIETVIKWAQD